MDRGIMLLCLLVLLMATSVTWGAPKENSIDVSTNKNTAPLITTSVISSHPLSLEEVSQNLDTVAHSTFIYESYPLIPREEYEQYSEDSTFDRSKRQNRVQRRGGRDNERRPGGADNRSSVANRGDGDRRGRPVGGNSNNQYRPGGGNRPNGANGGNSNEGSRTPGGGNSNNQYRPGNSNSNNDYRPVGQQRPGLGNSNNDYRPVGGNSRGGRPSSTNIGGE